jgi:hypothetical protein
MKTRNILNLGLLIGSAFMAQQASAQFQLIDDLTTHSAGNLAGQTATSGGTWQNLGTAGAITIGTSATTGGNAAIAGPLDGAAYLALPTAFASSSMAATFFMQFDLGSSQTANNLNWDLWTSTTGTDGGGANAVNAVELNVNVPNRAGLTLRNGSAFDEMSADGVNVFTPANNTIYDLWFVVNTSAHTFQVYMQGGALTSQTLMSIGTGAYSATPAAYTTTAAFRNASAGQALNDFVYGTGGTGNSGSEDLYSIFEDPNGVNLADPTAVPEPGTLPMLGLSGLISAFRLLRRKNK